MKCKKIDKFKKIYVEFIFSNGRERSIKTEFSKNMNFLAIISWFRLLRVNGHIFHLFKIY